MSGRLPFSRWRPQCLLQLMLMSLSIHLEAIGSEANFELDNGLIGVPNISCHPDTIEMRFRTKRQFTGKIYVQGHYNNPDCRVDFSLQQREGAIGAGDHDGRGGIRLHHGSCNMDRQRVVRPQEGMQFSTVLVISFHPLFVTKTDRAFHINCMYREDDRNVGADMTVNDVTPQPIQNDMPLPFCDYTIRKDAVDGEILKFARVGDLIVHRWQCHSDYYGMLVHSCYVEDGQGDRVQVIDERGCHKDPNVLADPTYTEALNLAYRESFVFKFRDRLGVRFSCEIKLCVKADDGCAGITPPDCQGVHFQNSRDDAIGRHNQSLAKNRIRRHAPRTMDADLISQYMFVLDEPVEGEEEEDKLLANQQASRLLLGGPGAPVCLSSSIFAALVLLVLLTFGLAAAVVGHAIWRQQKLFRAGAVLSCSSGSIGSGRSSASPTAFFLKR